MLIRFCSVVLTVSWTLSYSTNSKAWTYGSTKHNVSIAMNVRVEYSDVLSYAAIFMVNKRGKVFVVVVYKSDVMVEVNMFGKIFFLTF